MRIAINTRFLLSKGLEGIGWFTYEVVQRLVQKHPEHEFLFFFDRPYKQDFIFGNNVKPIVLQPPARHPLLWAWWFELTVPFALWRFKADLFFSPDGYASLFSPAPTVMVTHDIAHIHFPDHIPRSVFWYYSFFVPRYLKRVEHIITVSEFTKRDIANQYEIPEEKITVTGNGCRTGFSPLTEEEKDEVKNQYANGQDYLFYVGAIQPRKNIHRLIKAFDLFKKRRQSSIKLLIGGRFAWQTGVVKTAYENAHFQDDIIFLGYLEEATLPKLMGASLAFVYVSLFEGFGVPILEALNCGVPVITSTTSSMPEVVGKAGITVDPTSVEQISKAIHDLTFDIKLRNQYIQEATAQREKFSWDIISEKVYQVLLAVGEKRKSP